MVYRKSLTEKMIDVLLYAGMIVLMFVTLYPFWSQIVLSLEEGASAYSTGFMLYPRKLSFEAYRLAFHYTPLWTGYLNTIVRTVLGVVLILVFTALTAYPLSKKDLPLNRTCTGFLLFTMLFSGGLIPNYLLIKNLGLLNSVWSLVLPGMISAFNVLIMRNFFRSIPESLEESARVDGAGYVRIFVSLIVPLSTPVLATVALWVGVGHWNAWFDSLIYISDSRKQVLQVVLRKIVIENDTSNLNAMIQKMSTDTKYTGRQLQSTVIILSIIPMLVVYPFVQKYFVKGVMVGAIKG
ncbi:carbohydrate ABC transporter membrane protein 2, CUT1 family (TC 3.A.1.1.-) [Cohnella sp. OV330]|uniref:carbohydrate ABC transporter permease n=1 Tax=Cohnella sp. OV330 TaxID=1855288 RepID=UPI0008E06A3E|nr:carbohydrate ABC transporter permease [Cohnella sp. OV330]SFA75056.1 carbohydrate ABC transporter membrane protein 2, CUT1 family (TC 3.A.1.1.-) [Cohnella sp. OV330]